MSLTEQEENEINQSLKSWRQGDVCLDDGLKFFHIADLSKPHSNASIQVTDSLLSSEMHVENETTPVWQKVPGIVVLSQTCDIIRECRKYPYIQVAPLLKVERQWVQEIRLLKRPLFAYVPSTADKNLVADLDRTMTIEKAIVYGFKRIPGCNSDDERLRFASALARKSSRFAFPDEFISAIRPVQARLIDKHNKNSDEGAHIRALFEIRVRATPSWENHQVLLDWWFIIENDPLGTKVNWSRFIDQWLTKFDQSGRYSLDKLTHCYLEDMSAREYVDSVRLDLDRLSVLD